MFLDAAPFLPRPAHRLGTTVESHDPGAQPLPDGAARWVNRRSSRLPHRLLRSGGVPEPEGPSLLEGSACGGPSVAREGVGDVGGMVVVRGASGRWGRPLGPMEMHAVRLIIGAPTGPTTTKI
jgi:hypothetical protein